MRSASVTVGPLSKPFQAVITITPILAGAIINAVGSLRFFWFGVNQSCNGSSARLVAEVSVPGVTPALHSVGPAPTSYINASIHLMNSGSPAPCSECTRTFPHCEIRSEARIFESNVAADPEFGKTMKQLSVITKTEVGSSSDRASIELVTVGSPLAHEHRDAHSLADNWRSGTIIPRASSSLMACSVRAGLRIPVASAMNADGENQASVVSNAVRQAVV